MLVSQSNPEAMSMMMEASSDPALMAALQSAMKSPADLMKAGKLDPKVSSFLNRLWETMGMDPLDLETQALPQEEEKKEGALEAIQKLVGESLGLGDKKEGASEALAPSMPPPATLMTTSPPPLSGLRPVVMSKLEEEFKPEFLNRLDEVVVFTPLSEQELRSITENLLAGIAAQSKKEKEVVLTFEDSLVDTIVRESVAKSRRYGARPLKRTVLRYVEDALSDAMVSGFLKGGDEATVGLADGRGDYVKIKNGGATEEYSVQEAEEGSTDTGAYVLDESPMSLAQ